MRILVVDDDEIELAVLRNILTTAGFDVECACDGRAAMEMLCRDTFQIVIADWHMPGMDGLELCRSIRALEPSPYVYIIMITFHDSLMGRVEALSTAADDYIAKPYHPEELVARVRVGERIQNSALAKHNELLKSEIQQRRRVEEALRQSVRRYRSLTEISPVGIYHADVTGKFEYVNARWCELAGLTERQSLGYGWSSAIHPDDRERVLAELRELRQARATARSEYRFVHSTGRSVWVLGLARAELTDAGDVCAYVGTVTDITDRRQAEEARDAGNAEMEWIDQDMAVAPRG